MHRRMVVYNWIRHFDVFYKVIIGSVLATHFSERLLAELWHSHVNICWAAREGNAQSRKPSIYYNNNNNNNDRLFNLFAA